MNSNSKTLIMIFAKAPVSGQVKTRLIPALGPNMAVELYERFISHTLNTVTQLDNISIQLYCSPDTSHSYFQYCAENYSLKLKKQQGANLGERMQQAFRVNLLKYRQVIVIGCDCPELTAQDITDVTCALDRGHDAGIIPAYDGGYVLLGLTRYSATIFDKVNWGSESVLQQTQEKLSKDFFNCYAHSSLHDIDLPTDLIYCPQSLLEGIKYEMAG